jgi:hypothetical protein
MRKRYRVVLLAAIVAALIVPVGFALSLESSASTAVAPRTVVTTASTAPVASSIVLTPAGVNADDTPFTHPVPDAAKLLLVGTTLFGLAAAVRKAI